MATTELDQVRSEILQSLLDRVEADRYPSVTMLDMIESYLQPDDVPAYLRLLIERVDSETYPSIDMLQRIQRFF